MFEYVCDRVIPGCTSKEKGETPEAAREAARRHLHEHHDMEYLDADMSQKVTLGIVQVRS